MCTGNSHCSPLFFQKTFFDGINHTLYITKSDPWKETKTEFQGFFLYFLHFFCCRYSARPAWGWHLQCTSQYKRYHFFEDMILAVCYLDHCDWHTQRQRKRKRKRQVIGIHPTRLCVIINLVRKFFVCARRSEYVWYVEWAGVFPLKIWASKQRKQK